MANLFHTPDILTAESRAVGRCFYFKLSSDGVGSGTHMSAQFEHVNQSIDMTKVGRTMRRLHEQVCGEKRRIEVTRCGCDDVCVMISKKELECLETALQIMADTDSFNGMCDSLKKLLAQAHEVFGAPEQADA